MSAWGIKLGYREHLRGTYFLLKEPFVDRVIDLDLDVETPSVREFLHATDGRLAGTVSADGITSGAPARGTIAVHTKNEPRVLYAIAFEGDDGKSYAIRAQKSLSLLSVVDSISLLRGTLYEKTDDDHVSHVGREIGRLVLRLDVRGERRKLLRSIRLGLERRAGSVLRSA